MKVNKTESTLELAPDSLSDIYLIDGIEELIRLGKLGELELAIAKIMSSTEQVY